MNWPEITKDTPIEEIHRIHKAIWQYVVDYGEKPDTPYTNDCVLCAYDDILGDAHFPCSNCPAIWPHSKNIISLCGNHDSPFEKWLKAAFVTTSESDARHYAEQVRDIPFKYEQIKE